MAGRAAAFAAEYLQAGFFKGCERVRPASGITVALSALERG
jgi:hypothetical protein